MKSDLIHKFYNKNCNCLSSLSVAHTHKIALVLYMEHHKKRNLDKQYRTIDIVNDFHTSPATTRHACID